MEAIAYSRGAAARFVRELAELIRFPTVSAQPEHAQAMRRCATWIGDHLRAIGLDNVQIVGTPGHPIVTADWLHAPGRSTLLIYGHYDVQPPEPLDQWTSPPFDPAIRDEYLHGRGASDDKGQMFVHLKAIESYLRTSGSLPVNVKCIFEGEEEIGSRSLRGFLTRRGEEWGANAAVLSDMWMLGRDRPTIAESLRGALSVEVEVRGPERDLHSGNFGGAIHNPLQALCEMLAKLHDARGMIAVPNFYEGVRELTADERAYMARVGASDSRILCDAGAEVGWGEPGYSLYERTTIRPALSINGVVGGYQGPGAKAVIPARASVKLDFRLVPDQDPEEIDLLFRGFMARLAVPTMDVSVRTLFRARPFVLLRDHPAVHAACEALRKGFGVAPTFMRIGGTIPVAHLLQEELGIPTVPMGFALPDDGLHAPNERFLLRNFFRGIETSIQFLAGLAKL